MKRTIIFVIIFTFAFLMQSCYTTYYNEMWKNKVDNTQITFVRSESGEIKDCLKMTSEGTILKLPIPPSALDKNIYEPMGIVKTEQYSFWKTFGLQFGIGLGIGILTAASN